MVENNDNIAKMEDSSSKTRLPPIIPKANKRKSASQPDADIRRDKLFITQNRFEALSSFVEDNAPADDENNKQDIEMNEEDEVQANITTKQKSQKPPPVIVHGKPSIHKQFVQFIQANTNKNFNIKYSADNATVYLTDLEDWKRLKEALKQENAEYHSYTAKQDKTHAFVLNGLDNSTTEEEIEAELRENKLEVVKVYRMRSKSTLFLVITKNDVRLKHLMQNIKALCYTRVTWNRHYNKRIITQCHRCQMWNHATSNCNARPACVKCGEEHWTYECKKTKDTPATCVNCKGDHPANSMDCPIYKAKLEGITQKREIKPQKSNYQMRNEDFPKLRNRFVPAPPPTINPWTQAKCFTPSAIKVNSQIPRTDSSQIIGNNQEQHPKQDAPADNAPRVINHLGQTTMPDKNHPQQVMENPNVNQLTDVISEFQKLNSMVNLDKMLVAVRSLNSMLENCNTPIEKFQAFSKFAQNIASYGF